MEITNDTGTDSPKSSLSKIVEVNTVKHSLRMPAIHKKESEATNNSNEQACTAESSTSQGNEPYDISGRSRTNSDSIKLKNISTNAINRSGILKKRKYLSTYRKRADAKIVGLGSVIKKNNNNTNNWKNIDSSGNIDELVENDPSLSTNRAKLKIEENIARDEELKNAFLLVLYNGMASLKVFVVYLITLESIISVALTCGLTIYWHHRLDSEESVSMSWVLLGFAVVTPITVIVSMAFRRRELALLHITRLRSASFQIYLSHALWDWHSSTGGSGRNCAGFDWLKHTDKVLEELIGMGDELSRFLTLPTSSRSRHRMLKSGRLEAAQTIEVAYNLFDSLYTQRIIKLSKLTEVFKAVGLNFSEASRIRQYERFIGEAVEGLRMVKMYRTPQALRAFGRIFTVALPPLYAATFAQLALDTGSLAIGITMSVLTPLCLTALFESINALEDPFVGFITLDGINIKEELEVLHFNQFMSARKALFPDELEFDGVLGKVCKSDIRVSHHKREIRTNSFDSIRSSFHKR